LHSLNFFRRRNGLCQTTAVRIPIRKALAEFLRHHQNHRAELLKIHRERKFCFCEICLRLEHKDDLKKIFLGEREVIDLAARKRRMQNCPPKEFVFAAQKLAQRLYLQFSIQPQIARPDKFNLTVPVSFATKSHGRGAQRFGSIFSWPTTPAKIPVSRFVQTSYVFVCPTNSETPMHHGRGREQRRRAVPRHFCTSAALLAANRKNWLFFASKRVATDFFLLSPTNWKNVFRTVISRNCPRHFLRDQKKKFTSQKPDARKRRRAVVVARAGAHFYVWRRCEPHGEGRGRCSAQESSRPAGAKALTTRRLMSRS